MTSQHSKHSFPSVIRFFKIILTTTLAQGKLKLPKKFTRKYGDGLSNPVFLKSPSSSEWKIYWTKHDDEIWFQKGWMEFAKHYSLDHGHLLLFEYQGTSHFDVHIFDNNAVEIYYPSCGNRDGNSNLVEISDDDDSVETLDEQCHDGKDNTVKVSDDSVKSSYEQCLCQKTRVKSTVSSPQACKKMKNSISTNVERILSGVNLHQHVQIRSTRSQEAKFANQKLDDKGKGILHNECPKVEQFTSTALNKATTFTSKHPSFTLVMKPSFIDEDYLEIPMQFSEQYLKKTNAVVHLEILDGRRWPVICSAPIITGGWQKFVSKNHLNVGDVCVFELIHKIQGLTFKVSFFRVAEELSSLISHEVNLSKSWRVSHSTNSTGGNSSQISPQLESQFKLKILKISAVEEARKFKSKNPFFMVTLTLNLATTIVRSPRVPSNFVRKYFVDRKKKVTTIQFREKVWPLTFVFNEYDDSCTLSAGWSSLARQNKLEPGDVCIFELVNIEDVTLDLHVFRDHNKVMH